MASALISLSAMCYLACSPAFIADVWFRVDAGILASWPNSIRTGWTWMQVRCCAAAVILLCCRCHCCAAVVALLPLSLCCCCCRRRRRCHSAAAVVAVLRSLLLKGACPGRPLSAVLHCHLLLPHQQFIYVTLNLRELLLIRLLLSFNQFPLLYQKKQI